MEHLTQIIVAIFASTGFWAFCQFLIQRYFDRKSAIKAALLGLLHERLVESCEAFLKRGYLSEGEYRDLNEYIYTPYKNLGGNGNVWKLISNVVVIILNYVFSKLIVFRKRDGGDNKDAA